MKVNIYNQCSCFGLIRSEYFDTGVDWKERPNWKIDTGNMMSADLIPFLSTFGGVLTYELQSGYGNFGNQSESTYIRLLVAWKSESYNQFSVYTHLIKCNEQVKWNETKLEVYYQRYANQLCTYTGPIKDTWLIDDGTVLLTELDLDFTQRDGVLNITISKGIKDESTRRPEWIDSKM
jgi:hypothetical protein